MYTYSCKRTSYTSHQLHLDILCITTLLRMAFTEGCLADDAMVNGLSAADDVTSF